MNLEKLTKCLNDTLSVVTFAFVAFGLFIVPYAFGLAIIWSTSRDHLSSYLFGLLLLSIGGILKICDIIHKITNEIENNVKKLYIQCITYLILAGFVILGISTGLKIIPINLLRIYSKEDIRISLIPTPKNTKAPPNTEEIIIYLGNDVTARIYIPKNLPRGTDVTAIIPPKNLKDTKIQPKKEQPNSPSSSPSSKNITSPHGIETFLNGKSWPTSFRGRSIHDKIHNKSAYMNPNLQQTGVNNQRLPRSIHIMPRRCV